MPPKKPTYADAIGATISSVVDENKNSQFILEKERKASFVNFVYDSKGSCTSTKVLFKFYTYVYNYFYSYFKAYLVQLAEAGFYFVGEGTGEDSPDAKCPFCLKTMTFDPDDDPWYFI